MVRQNCKPVAKAADDLRRDVARMAAELGQAMQPRLRRKTSAHLGLLRIWILLEESIWSINVIGRVCCSPFTGAPCRCFGKHPVHAMAHTPLVTKNSASGFGKLFGTVCTLGILVRSQACLCYHGGYSTPTVEHKILFSQFQLRSST
jgi:hypothetical protein